MVREVIDHPDHVIWVTQTGLGLDVPGKSQLAPVAHLPLGLEAPPAEEHAKRRPATGTEAASHPARTAATSLPA